jgi:lipoprotein-anchoring transpeptidase ErfK/SrfK
MRRALGFIAIWIFAWSGTTSAQSSPYSIEIDLQDQTAYLIRDGRAVLSTPISSGRYGHLTGTGSFKVIEKERNHFSNIYGRIVDARGNTVVADADSDMRVPRGYRFVPAPMRYFVRFDGANGLHAGILPGYAASHGCVRLPEQNAIAIFNAIDVGTPVTVFGTTPRGRASFGSDITMQQRGSRQVYNPRFEERFTRPPWSR